MNASTGISSKEIRLVPIGSVIPRQGIPYLSGYNGSGNNPAMFLDRQVDGQPTLVVACSTGVQEFRMECFDAAIACYRRALRQNRYKPADVARWVPIQPALPMRVSPRKTIGDVPVGQAICFLAGYQQRSNHPTIYAHGGDERGEQFVVVDNRSHERFSIRNFPQALAHFRSRVEDALKAPAHRRIEPGMAGVAILAAFFLLLLVLGIR